MGNYAVAIADYETAGVLDHDYAPDPAFLYSLHVARDNAERIADHERNLAEMESLRAEHERRLAAEVTRLESEQNQFADLADQEIATLKSDNARLAKDIEQLHLQLAEMRDQLEQLQLAFSNMHIVPSRPKPADTDAKADAVEVVYYKNGPEFYPFIYEWQVKRSKESQQRIRNAIDQMRKGNFGDSKSLHADDLFERRLHTGERIYYAKPSSTSVVILHGGDKADSDQDGDIDIALERLRDHRQQQ